MTVVRDVKIGVKADEASKVKNDKTNVKTAQVSNNSKATLKDYVKREYNVPELKDMQNEVIKNI